MAPLFRWGGAYWGFIAGDGVFDRYGRHVAWLEGDDVFDLSGRFMGELREGQYVLRNRLRPAPVHRAPRPAAPHPTPAAPPPERAARDPLDDWADALPWPLPPPEPPRL
ncbi:MAG: 4-fold beta flower protein [Candidatus Rokuibacteriota bacterium]